jgi:phasin
MNEASKIARESFDKTLETSAKTVQEVQEGCTLALENVRDLNVRLIDMARANTDAAFDFAREVAEANAPSDLVQAWTTHATKQFDMLTKQASELTTLGQQFASTSSEPIKRRVGQALK